MTRLEEARGLAAQAKAVYQQRLAQIDGILRAEVSRDPATLPDAEALQASYADGLSHAALAANEQPSAQEPVTEPVDGVVARLVKKIKGGK